MTAALLKPPSGQVSDEDFEQFLGDYEGIERWELIDGVIRAMPEPSVPHQLLISWLIATLQVYFWQVQFPWVVLSNVLCKLADRGQYRRPDLFVADKETLRRCNQRQAILTHPPKLAIEIVSTNWRDDYETKAQHDAAWGIAEYWIVDLLLTQQDYPSRHHPEIAEPTLSLGLLQAGSYQWQRYTSDCPIVSPTFPDLTLSVQDLLAAIA